MKLSALEYATRGIWGILATIQQHYKASDWGIRLSCNSQYLNVSENTGIQITKEDKQTFGKQGNLYIPIYPLEDKDNRRLSYLENKNTAQKKLVFDFFLKSAQEIQKHQIKEIQYALQLFVRYEASLKYQYPSFLPCLFSTENTMDKVNQSIKEKKRIIFLNGQDATGKHTFLQCYTLFNFYKMPCLESVNQNIYKTEIQGDNTFSNVIYFIPEVALLTYREQRMVCEKIDQVQQRDSDCKAIIMTSIYDPNVLLDKNIITESLFKKIKPEIIRLPSLKNRASELDSIIHFVHQIKLLPKLTTDNLMDIISQPEITNNNFQGIYNCIYQQYYIDNIMYTYHQDHLNLRKIVNSIEQEAIKYAKKITKGSQYHMSNFLGISRGSLQHKMRKYTHKS